MDIDNLITQRRTIHNFKPEKPPREILLKAVETARWAPNHYLSEPWRFYLLGEETANAITDLNADLIAQKKGPQAAEKKRRRWRNIPGWLVVTCEKSDNPLRYQEDYAACCCAIHNLSLYLWSQGIGIKWTTGNVIRTDEFYDTVWLDPETETVVGLLWYGYPTDIPKAHRKSISEILTELP